MKPIIINEREYTISEIMSFPLVSMYKEGVNCTHFRLDEKHGVAFLADLVGELVPDDLDRPEYIFLKNEKSQATQDNSDNNFLEKISDYYSNDAKTKRVQEQQNTEEESVFSLPFLVFGLLIGAAFSIFVVLAIYAWFLI